MRLFARRRIAGDLWLPSWALDVMSTDADDAAPNETGGALMGYASEDGVVVTEVINAGPKAVRTPTRFIPDEEYQLAQIATVYERSGRIHTYIGDWHSHPGGLSAYSRIDRSALTVVSGSSDARCEEPVMIILGGEPPWTVMAWRYDPGRWLQKVNAMRLRLFT